MLRIRNIIIAFVCLLVLSACKKEEELKVNDQFFLKNGKVEMPVFVRGNLESKTVLVILHGGPGGSSLRHYYQLPEFTDALEEKYLLVYWEQRGAGMSSGKIKDNEFTIEHMEQDLNKLFYVLEHKYGNNNQFFLLGQSFGSLLGSKFISSSYAEKHQINGWITIGGVYSFNDYSKRVVDYAQQFLDLQTDAIWNEHKETVSKIDAKESDLETFSLANELGQDMQNTARETGQANERVLTDIKSNGFYNPVQTFINHNKSNEAVLNDIKDLNLKEELKSVNIPAVFIYGDHDFVTPRSYGDDLMTFYGAVDKSLVVIEKGTHNPLATNIEETQETIISFVDTHN